LAFAINPKVHRLWLRGSGFWAQRFWVQDSKFNIQDSGVRKIESGVRFQVSGVRKQRTEVRGQRIEGFSDLGFVELKKDNLNYVNNY
jgi:hypothetical protein